jgi:capsular polysaccharide biosynthesis protein
MTLVAEVEAARQPTQALLRCLDGLFAAGDTDSAATGAALFETFWHALPPFDDARVPAVASALYARLGAEDGAVLLAALAEQLQPSGRVAVTDGDVHTQAAAIAATREPGSALLHALEALEGDLPASVALFESVWQRVAPMVEYWVYHRMANVYAALDRPLAALLLAGLAVQIEPASPASDAPHRHVLAWFQSHGRTRDAALLCRRRAKLCPEPTLLPAGELAALFDAAGTLPAAVPPTGRRDIALAARDIRPAQSWPCYGGDAVGLQQLRRTMVREPIFVAELHDAELLLDGGAVAVHGLDGQPHIDLSLRDYPALVRRRLDAARARDLPVEELNLDDAVLIGDEFPGANLCHFMLDQASRLALYRNAGVNIEAATVIGPELRGAFQRIIGTRMGVRAYIATTRRARIRVGRLFVSSNCRHLRHPAHWGAEWAVRAVRDMFDVTPRQPARRLLISRADSPFRRIANEPEVAELLARCGFETIVPGRLPFADQIAAFRDATHIVGGHGAGLANILFSPPGTRVLEVFHPLYGTWAYAMIAPTLGLEYATMIARDGDSDDPIYNDSALPQQRRNEHSGRDMRVDLNQLQRWLAESGAC